MNQAEPYLRSIQSAYPDLAIHSTRLNQEGQNNAILIINDALIFRFPRYASAIERLEREVAILSGIQNFITLEIPNPTFTRLNAPAGQAFVGYRLIPGEPLWSETLLAVQDECVLDRLAEKLAQFLNELHSVSAQAIIDCALPVADTPAEWAGIYARIQTQCFPHMRPEARAWAAHHFEAFLGNPRNFDYEPVLKHGDFGTSNILFDAPSQTITGVIDFGGAGLGDPAYDFAGILSSYGEAFLHRFERTYPEIISFWERIQFYLGTFALLEALFGLENDDQAAFNSGIQDYR